MKSRHFAPFLLALFLVQPLSVEAKTPKQGKTAKKVYCWEEHGKRTCSDTPPPEAAAGTFNPRTGNVITNQPTPPVLAPPPPVSPEQARVDALIQAYPTEKDLRERFGFEKKQISTQVDDAKVQISALQLELREHLQVLGDKELRGKPISKAEYEKALQLKDGVRKAREDEKKAKARLQALEKDQAYMLEQYRLSSSQ